MLVEARVRLDAVAGAREHGVVEQRRGSVDARRVVACRADGGFTITKPAGSGGLVTPATVAEQLVYEIGDPARYILADVICDFTAVTLHHVGHNSVEVRGARGYALQLRFDTTIAGPCMRCLTPTSSQVSVDVRELQQSKRDPEEQFDSDYVKGDDLDLHRWANDSFVFSLPVRVLCRDDCKGLCPECGKELNDDPTHSHEKGPDPRLAALSGIRFDDDGNLVQGP